MFVSVLSITSLCYLEWVNSLLFTQSSSVVVDGEHDQFPRKKPVEQTSANEVSFIFLPFIQDRTSLNEVFTRRNVPNEILVRKLFSPMHQSIRVKKLFSGLNLCIIVRKRLKCFTLIKLARIFVRAGWRCIFSVNLLRARIYRNRNFLPHTNTHCSPSLPGKLCSVVNACVTYWK